MDAWGNCCSSLPDGELSFEIFKAEKAVGSIEFLIILAVAALNFAVVARRIWANKFVPYAKALQFPFKECWLVIAFWKQTIGKFSAIVCLNTFNGKRKFFDHMAQELRGGISAVFLESLYVPKTAVLIQEGILEPLCWLLLPNNTDLWHKLHIDLHSLTGILHLLIGLWYVFRVRQLGGHGPSLTKKPV